MIGVGTWVIGCLHLGIIVVMVVVGCCGLPSSSLLSVDEMDSCKSDVGDALVGLPFFLSSGLVADCCCTRSISLVFGGCDCSLGDFFLVVAFPGLRFFGCSSLSIVILFGVDVGRVVGTSTGICLRVGTRTSSWVVMGASLGTSLVASLVVVGSGEDEDDLAEAGGVGSVGESGEAEERVFLGGDGDLCLLCFGDVGKGDGGGDTDGLVIRGGGVDPSRRQWAGSIGELGGVEGDLCLLLLGDLWCLLLFSGAVGGDGVLLCCFLDVFLGLLLLVASLLS